MTEWAIIQYCEHIKEEEGKSPALNKSVCDDPKFPELRNFKIEFKEKSKLYLYGTKIDQLLQYNKPAAVEHEHLKYFFRTTREERNQIFHRLKRLREEGLFAAWGTNTSQQWQKRVIGCLNFLSDQNFTSLESASLMTLVHEELKTAIASYTPS
jgi:hypothetical protein